MTTYASKLQNHGDFFLQRTTRGRDGPKTQVFIRIPAYIRLHKVKSVDRAILCSPADIAQRYSKMQPPETCDPRPRLLLLYGQTFDIARVLNRASSGSITVLNMASEKRAGGRLFKNSLQQEASLCMQSDLYHRLLRLERQLPITAWPNSFILMV